VPVATINDHQAKQANQMHKNLSEFRPTNIAIKPGTPITAKSRHVLRIKLFLEKTEHSLISCA
jgi:hypothetical protein